MSDVGRPRTYAVEEEEEILRRFTDNPTLSTNAVASQLGISQWKVWSTVHSAGLYPYHYTPVHVREGDPLRRMIFLQIYILWTDESNFDKDGITNYHNIHHWDEKEQ